MEAEELKSLVRLSPTFTHLADSLAKPTKKLNLMHPSLVPMQKAKQAPKRLHGSLARHSEARRLSVLAEHRSPGLGVTPAPYRGI